MSKNECKRCSECKHYERVNDNEPEDHGDCTLYPVWVDVWAAHYCGQWAAVKTAKEEAPTSELDIDWSQVPEGYDWAAQDEDGYVYGYPDKPTLHESTIDGLWRWKVPECDQHYVGHGQARHSQFSKTLTKRPV